MEERWQKQHLCGHLEDSAGLPAERLVLPVYGGSHYEPDFTFTIKKYESIIKSEGVNAAG